MIWLEIIYQEVNESRLTINLIKYRGRKEKGSSTIDFKAFFFFVCVYTLFLTVIILIRVS